MTTETIPPVPALVATRPRQRWRRLGAALVIGALIAIFPIRRAIELAADPVGPKDCPPDDPGRDGAGGAGAAQAASGSGAIASASDVPWLQRGGTINDASCLSRTAVHGIVDVRTVDDARRALTFARANGLKVSVAGVKHSMGGHAFAHGAVVLDMTKFNKMSLDAANKVLRVESGATWHDIQTHLHPRFAVKAMQSTDIFTVGGSISVNAHGMDHQAGSVGRTVRAMRVMLPDGTIQMLSPTENARLFNLVIGGYGLFGVILDVDLDVTDNAVYQSERRVVDYRAFPEVLTKEILPNASVGLMYGHLSTAPHTFLQEMLLYTYRAVDGTGTTVPPLGEVGQVKLRRLVFNLAKYGGPAMRLKWAAEKHLEPLLEACPVSRNQAMGEGEACLVSRNHPMHDSVAYLRNNLPRETDILHEYFIPQDRFVSFTDDMRRIMQLGEANLLNASVRVVHKEDNFLSYAPSDNMLAIVLYLNQSTDREGSQGMSRLTQRLIDACAAANGRFFLPYQLHYTAAQLQRAYPEIGAFFAAKKEIDPEELLTNSFYRKYSGSIATR